MNHPKPEKRAPRPRKRIARGKAPNKVRRTSRGALGRLADKLFSLIVRQQGSCRYHWLQRNHYTERNGACSGPLQCAHIVSRRYRSTRWDEDNAVPLCAAAHMKFTHDVVGWQIFVTQHVMDAARYQDLMMRSQERWDGDLEGTVARLKARAAILEIKC